MKAVFQSENCSGCPPRGVGPQVTIGGRVVRTLGYCDTFGERALLYDEPRCARRERRGTGAALMVLHGVFSRRRSALGPTTVSTKLKRRTENKNAEAISRNSISGPFAPTPLKRCKNKIKNAENKNAEAISVNQK